MPDAEPPDVWMPDAEPPDFWVPDAFPMDVLPMPDAPPPDAPVPDDGSLDGSELADGSSKGQCPALIELEVDAYCRWTLTSAQLAHFYAGVEGEGLTCAADLMTGRGYILPAHQGRLNFYCRSDEIPADIDAGVDRWCNVPLVVADHLQPQLTTAGNVRWRVYEDAPNNLRDWPAQSVVELCQIQAIDNCGVGRVDRIIAISSTPPVAIVPQPQVGGFVGENIVTTDRLVAVSPDSNFQSLDIVYAIWDEYAAFQLDDARRGEVRCHVEIAMSPTCQDIVCLNGSCVEAQGAPICDCHPGWTGDACADCDEGFERQGDECVRTEQ